MAAAITSSRVELIVLGLATALMLSMAGVRAYRRRRYRARRAAARATHGPDAAPAPSTRAARGRQPVAPSFSSAPEQVERS